MCVLQTGSGSDDPSGICHTLIATILLRAAPEGDTLLLNGARPASDQSGMFRA